MLFYVRDKVRSAVIQKDNGDAGLLEKEIMSEKITCMNGAIQIGLAEKTLDFSTIVKEDIKLQKHGPDKGQPCDISSTSQDQCINEHNSIEVINASTFQNKKSLQKAPNTLPDGVDTLSTKVEQIVLNVQRDTDDGHPSNISATSQDQCSNAHGSTEVTTASTSQNNEPVQNTCSHLDGTATSTKTEQTAPASQRETMSTVQPDACILCDASTDHKAYEKPLQDMQLDPDGALTDSGKGITAAAFQLSNGADGLLGANKPAIEPETEAFCKPTPDSDATTIAPVIPTEVALRCALPFVLFFLFFIYNFEVSMFYIYSIAFSCKHGRILLFLMEH
jgi:ubiquitin carboxyl-terminal hydrolase 36/42